MPPPPLTTVLKCNGTAVNNLRDLVTAVETCNVRYIRLDLEYNQVVILELGKALEATKAILEMHCIPADRSSDMLSN